MITIQQLSGKGTTESGIEVAKVNAARTIDVQEGRLGAQDWPLFTSTASAENNPFVVLTARQTQYKLEENFNHEKKSTPSDADALVFCFI